MARYNIARSRIPISLCAPCALPIVTRSRWSGVLGTSDFWNQKMRKSAVEGVECSERGGRWLLAGTSVCIELVSKSASTSSMRGSDCGRGASVDGAGDGDCHRQKLELQNRCDPRSRPSQHSPLPVVPANKRLIRSTPAMSARGLQSCALRRSDVTSRPSPSHPTSQRRLRSARPSRGRS
jgi:hypothetical protein